MKTKYLIASALLFTMNLQVPIFVYADSTDIYASGNDVIVIEGDTCTEYNSISASDNANVNVQGNLETESGIFVSDNAAITVEGDVTSNLFCNDLPPLRRTLYRVLPKR